MFAEEKDTYSKERRLDLDQNPHLCGISNLNVIQDLDTKKGRGYVECTTLSKYMNNI
jgi:hypothetical protein